MLKRWINRRFKETAIPKHLYLIFLFLLNSLTVACSGQTRAQTLGQTSGADLKLESSVQDSKGSEKETFALQFFTFVQDTARAELFWDMSANSAFGELSRFGEKFIRAASELETVKGYVSKKVDFAPNLQVLSQKAKGTLGRTYADYMKEHQLDPDFFPMLEESSERNRIINWSRKTHDIMHLVAGYGSDLGEEIGWQAFYSANTQSPLGMVVVAMGIVHLALFNPDSLLEHLKLVTEAYERGKLASSLLDFNWEQNFDKPIEQVRSTLRLVARKSQVSSLTKKSDISY